MNKLYKNETIIKFKCCKFIIHAISKCNNQIGDQKEKDNLIRNYNNIRRIIEKVRTLMKRS